MPITDALDPSTSLKKSKTMLKEDKTRNQSFAKVVQSPENLKMGFLSSQSLSQRTLPLHLHGPAGQSFWQRTR